VDIVGNENTLGITVPEADILSMDYVVIRPRTMILIPRLQSPYGSVPPVKTPEDDIELPEESDRKNYFRELGRLGGKKTSDDKTKAARRNARRRWYRYRRNKAAGIPMPKIVRRKNNSGVIRLHNSYAAMPFPPPPGRILF
jgi:hypothetical protein